MDGAQALTIVQRYVPDPTEAAALLAEQTFTRSVLGVPVTLYDPYAAALAYLMNPATVKARTEGSVSETYIDPAQVAAYLRQESTTLRESWPAADTETAWEFPDLSLEIVGWRN